MLVERIKGEINVLYISENSWRGALHEYHQGRGGTFPGQQLEVV
jgi:hypothetical protein